MSDTTLTISDKERLVADIYIAGSCQSATQAVIEAGYSPRSAKVTASRIFSRPAVAAYVAERTTKIFDKLEITQERVMREYARIGFSDVRQYFDEHGALKPLTELDDDAAAAIASVETEEITENIDGIKVKVGETRKVKFWDKKGSLDSICKIKGWNAPEEVKHTGKIRVGYGKEEE